MVMVLFVTTPMMNIASLIHIASFRAATRDIIDHKQKVSVCASSSGCLTTRRWGVTVHNVVITCHDVMSMAHV